VKAIPPRGGHSTSPYDEVAAKVRESGEVARIVATKTTLNSLANRLRERFKDLTVAARTEADGFYVYLERKAKK
jgi:uncharacterized membrane protein YfbV (UPF0208 family)